MPCLTQDRLSSLLHADTPHEDDLSHVNVCPTCLARLAALCEGVKLDDRLERWQSLRKEFAPFEVCWRVSAADASDTVFPSEGGVLVVPGCGQSGDTAVHEEWAGTPRQPNRTLGGCVLGKQIGQGGMGTVFEAKNVMMDKEVAIKVIRADRAGDPIARARFVEEARAMAKVRHENVVEVLHASEDGGDLFLVMELLHGETLKARIERTGPLSAAEAIDVGRQAARGLDAIHQHGVLHRDVKSANLFVETTRRVRVLDLGLARSERCAVSLTQTGGVVGTPEFMAPEQASGEKTDARADVYGLGVALFHALTGRVPFVADTPEKLLAAAIKDEPPRLADLRPDLPAELATLVQQMLEKKPDKRPASARKVAQRLEAIILLPPPPRPLFPRWVALAVAGLAALIVIIITLAVKDKNGNRAELALRVSGDVEPAKKDAGDGSKEKNQLPKGGPSVLDRLDRATIPPPEKRDWHPKGLVAVLGQHQENKGNTGIISLAFSREGTRLLTGGEDGYVRWWDVANQREVLSFEGRKNSAVFAALSPNGRWSVSAGQTQRLRLYDLEQKKELAVFGRFGMEETVQGTPQFSPDGKTFLAAHRDSAYGPSTVKRWDLDGKKPVEADVSKHAHNLGKLALSPDGKRFVAIDGSRALKLWDASTGKELARFPIPQPFGNPVAPIISDVCWSPDGKSVLSSDAPLFDHRQLPRNVRIWEFKGDSPQLKKTYTDLEGAPRFLAWSPDGTLIAYGDTGETDKDATSTLIVRDAASGVERTTVQWTGNLMQSLAFAPDGQHLAVGTRQGVVYVLRLPPRK